MVAQNPQLATTKAILEKMTPVSIVGERRTISPPRADRARGTDRPPSTIWECHHAVGGGQGAACVLDWSRESPCLPARGFSPWPGGGACRSSSGRSPTADRFARSAMNARVWRGESVRWYLTRAKHPFKSYIVGHYWWWFEKFDVWIKYDGGGVINVALGDYVQQQIFFDGYYERPLVEWLKRTLTSTDVFWDVGANIGAVSLVAAGLCHVSAFEPDLRSLERMKTSRRTADRSDRGWSARSSLGRHSIKQPAQYWNDLARSRARRRRR